MTETVWLIQPPSIARNYADASRFGVMESILDSQDRPSIAPGPMLNKIKTRLARDYHEGDYILWVGGDPSSLFLTGVALRDLNVPEVKYLIWEKKKDREGNYLSNEGYYKPVTMRL